MPLPAVPADAPAPTLRPPKPRAPPATPDHLRPRLILQTLTRGDGLLGLRAAPGFGPRGAQLTVARIAWTYTTDGGQRWETPAPTRVLNTRPQATELLRGPWDQRVLLQRDRVGEGDASDALWASGLRPLPANAFQWRSPEAAEGHEDLWSLAEEAQWGGFWADQVPRLQALGWQVVVRPGFAHQSVAVERWRLVIDPQNGHEQGQEPDLQGMLGRPLSSLRQPPRQGSWLLSLGVDVGGETLDLAPLLAAGDAPRFMSDLALRQQSGT